MPKIYKRMPVLPEGLKIIFEPIKKECYKNVYKFVSENKDRFEENNMKIAYGYANFPKTMPNLWIRHCFILYEEKVIDITVKDEGLNNEAKYIVFKTFKSIDELMSIKEYWSDTSLAKTLLKDELDCIRPLMEDRFRNLLYKTKYSLDTVILKNF